MGAGDRAINTNAPAGIRLLPDPVFNGQSLNVTPGVPVGVTALDSRAARASNRFVPIQLAPDYSEGLVRVEAWGLAPPLHPFIKYLPGYNGEHLLHLPGCQEPQRSYDLLPRRDEGNAIPRAGGFRSDVVIGSIRRLWNPPTSWYWNIRIGDKVRINGSGIYYTVVGPMQITNPELFVNVGDPEVTPPLLQPKSTAVHMTNYNPPSSCSLSMAWTTTTTGTWTTAGTASTTMGTASLIKSSPQVSIHSGTRRNRTKGTGQVRIAPERNRRWGRPDRRPRPRRCRSRPSRCPQTRRCCRPGH